MPGVPIHANPAFRGFLRASGVSIARWRGSHHTSGKLRLSTRPAGISCKQSRRDEQKGLGQSLPVVRAWLVRGLGAILRNLLASIQNALPHFKADTRNVAK